MRIDEAINIRLDPTDIVEIETQYDERRHTVLYVHVNGRTVLRIQGLSEDSQLINIQEANGSNILTLHAHSKMEFENR